MTSQKCPFSQLATTKKHGDKKLSNQNSNKQATGTDTLSLQRFPLPHLLHKIVVAVAAAADNTKKQ
jgi:hypothetical protein